MRSYEPIRQKVFSRPPPWEEFFQIFVYRIKNQRYTKDYSGKLGPGLFFMNLAFRPIRLVWSWPGPFLFIWPTGQGWKKRDQPNTPLPQFEECSMNSRLWKTRNQIEECESSTPVIWRVWRIWRLCVLEHSKHSVFELEGKVDFGGWESHLFRLFFN